MSVVLQIYAIIVTLSLIIVLSFYLFHRREVTRLSQKLQTLLHSFTHAELTLDFPSSDITDLVNALNELLRVYHKQVYSLQKKDEAIKETITNLALPALCNISFLENCSYNSTKYNHIGEENDNCGWKPLNCHIYSCFIDITNCPKNCDVIS